MCGLSGEVAIDDPDVAESAALLADSAALVADSAATLRPLQDHAKKSAVWCPHDNRPDLLKELVWE